MTNGTAPQTMEETPVLVKTPEGAFVPVQPDQASYNPAKNPWSPLSFLMDAPDVSLGRRTTARWLNVDTMEEMATDELIAFLKRYLTALLVDAEYVIECADPQIAAFFRAMYGAVHREFILNGAPALFYGFQPLVKRFAFQVPETIGGPPVWTQPQKPYVWTGTRQVALRDVEPQWNNDGSFGGIAVRFTNRVIEPPYALWLTIGKHWVWGDYYGWGRARAAYKPWWRKHFTNDQIVLFVQRGADPAVEVRHPSGVHKESGLKYSDIAKDVGDAVRGGATVALPSDVYVNLVNDGYNETLTNTPKWAVSYLINTANPGPLMEITDGCDRQICLAMLVPSQVILNSKSLGLGGPNTVETLSAIAEHTLMEDAAQFDEHVNKYVFPSVLAWNFGSDAPVVRKRTTGLNDTTRAMLKSILDALLKRADVNPTGMSATTIAARLGAPTQQEDPAWAPVGSKGTTTPVVPQTATQGATTASLGKQTAQMPPATPIAASIDLSPIFVPPDPPEAARVAARVFASAPRSAEDYQQAIERLITTAAADLDQIGGEVARGELPPRTAVTQIGRVLRAGGLEAVSLGRQEKGEDGTIPVAEMDAVMAWLRFQQRHLEGVYSMIADATPEEKPQVVETIRNARLPMYANSIKGEYERARARFRLRRYPGSGDTTCLTRCRCFLRWGEDAQGPFVRWIAGGGDGECADCQGLAAGGPYRAGDL